MITKRWVTMKEACTYLSVSPSTIERWVAEGRLTKHRVEGHRAVRFSLKELGALLIPTFDDAAGPDRCMVCGGPLLSPLQRKHWECFEHLEILPPWDDQAPPEQTGGRCPCPKSESCDHVWCWACKTWSNDTGNGPSCACPETRTQWDNQGYPLNTSEDLT